MKKFLKIFGIAVASLIGFILIVSIIISIVASNFLNPIIKKEGAKYINANFDYKKLSVSLIRHFPNVSVSVKGFYVDGIDGFDGIRLIDAGEVSAAVNLFSIFSDDGYKITKVMLKDIYANAVVLEDGKVNWDIIKPSEKEEEKEEDDGESFLDTLNIVLQKVTLNNINATYTDKKSQLLVEAQNLNATVKGNFGLSNTVLDLKSELGALSFKMNDIPFLTKANIEINSKLDADLVNKKFGLNDTLFRLNSIKAELVGWAQLLDKKIDLELALLTNEINFKDLMSLIPETYAGSLDGVKAGGNVSLKASAKGAIEGSSYPAFDLALIVKDADFKYSQLPTSVDKINLNLTATSLGGSLDNAVAKIAPLSFSIAGNLFKLNASASNAISDLTFDAAAKGFINLAKIKDVLPIQNLDLTGAINADLNVGGKLSYIEKNNYEKFGAKGFVKITDMKVNMENLPKVDLKKATLNLTSQYLNLSDTLLSVEGDDILLTSRFENYLAYLFKGKTIRGNLNVQSNSLNVDKIMASMKSDSTKTVEKKSEEKKATVANDDKTKSKVIVVPKNIDFNADLNIKNLIFQEIAMKNILGKLIVQNGTANLQKISVDVFDGNVAVNGKYSTAASETNPFVDAKLNLNRVSFSKIFKDIKFLKTFVPLGNDLNGTFSSNIALSTNLKSDFSPELKTMNGSGVIKTDDVDLAKIKVIKVIGELSKNSDIKNFTTPNLSIDFTIKNGKIITKPFDIKVGSTVMTFSGSSTLDKKIDYSGKIKTATGIEIPLIINGDFDEPKVKLDAAQAAKKTTESLISKGIEELTGKSSQSSPQNSSKNDVVKDAASKLFNALKKR